MHIPTYLELQEIISIVQWILTITTITTLILFPYLFFLVLRKSTKDMEVFKNTLLVFLTIALIVALLYYLWQPIPLLPYQGGISVGVIRYLGPMGTAVMVPISITLHAVETIVELYGLCYLYHLMKGNSVFSFIFDNIKRSVIMIVIYMGTLIILTIALMLEPAIKMTRSNLYDFSALENTEFKQLMDMIDLNDNTFFGTLVSYSGYSIAASILMFVPLVLHFLLIIGLNVGLILMLNRTRESVSDTTHLLQIKFIKSFMFLSLLTVIFMIIPLMIIVVAATFNLYFTTLCIFVYTMIPVGIPISFITMIVLFKPYRTYTIKKVKSIFVSVTNYESNS